MLQDFLVSEFKDLFADLYLKNAAGELSLLNIYPQYLPAKTGAKDTKHYPYIRVILTDGADTTETDPNSCKVLIEIGVNDNNPNYQGYRDLCNIIQKIYDHLMRTKIFQNKYEIEYPILWALSEEDLFPHFIGGLETNWTVGKITMDDPLI
jgi:hypothetical protein